MALLFLFGILEVIALGIYAYNLPDNKASRKFKLSADNYYHFGDGDYKPYYVNILNEHEVLLMSNTDTISLRLENATVLADETLIFITPKQ